MIQMKQWMKMISLAMIFVLLAGCSAGGATTTTTTAAQTQTAGTQTEKPGILAQFTTTDLVSGEVIDQELLKKYELTMVNVWTTTCGYCIKEMPALGELAAEYEPRGVRILGFVGDVINSDGSISESQMKTAQEIVEATGASYPHMIPSVDLYGILNQITSVPTTFFVDSEGKQVGYAYTGAQDKNGWIDYIEKMLVEVRK